MPRNIYEDLQHDQDTKSSTFDTTFGINPPYSPEQKEIIDLRKRVAELEMQIRTIIPHIGALEANQKKFMSGWTDYPGDFVPPKSK